MTIFPKYFILDVWQGCQYALDTQIHRDTHEGWYIPNWLQYPHQTKNFPLLRSHIRKYKIQANKRLTKAKEKWSTVKFNVCVLSFIFLVPMFQTKWHACQQWHVSYGEDLSLECVSWIWHNQKFKILVSFWVDHSR